ncbi:MAG: IS4 family transposase [Alphaproteobacteria bacterium]|nr:IS4 family transposase [Alphaproteobacteria bacterium]
MPRTQNSWNKSPGISASLGLANIFRTFDPSIVDAALKKARKGTKRYRDFPAEAVVYFVIAMALYMHVNLREVLFCLIEGLRMVRGADIKITGKSGISQARTRIGAEPLRVLYEQTVQPIATRKTKGAWRFGKRLVSIDGSTLDVPDETENRRAYHGPTTFNDESPFPQIRFVCLAEIGTRVLFAAKMAGYPVGEVTLAHGVIKHLQPDMLCLADRGFFGYALWQEARKTGADLLWRMRADIRFPVEKVLPDGSYLSSMSTLRSKRNHEKPIPVRIVEYCIEGVEGAKKTSYRLATSLLDPDQAPAEDLAHLYQQRWEIETAFDEFKTHLRGSRLCLRSKTPELVEQEFFGLMLAHFTVRGLMHEASLKAKIDPDELSFTHSLRVIRRTLPLAAALPP